MKNLEQIRQGDILLVVVEDKIPPAGVATKQEVILAEGELTGHAHCLTAPVIYDWEENGQRYIRVAGARYGSLYHEDHDPVATAIIAPETTYRVIPQREWDLEGQWRKVVD